ncbi:MAG: SRPBCC family protein [Actinomycetota bacterium]
MISFENTVTISRKLEDVFAFLADFENIPAWNYAISETIKTSEGPLGVGSTYRQLRHVPRRSEEAFEVTTFKPPRELAIAGTLGPFASRLSYLLEPIDGGTRLVNRVELEPRGVLRLLGNAAASRIKERSPRTSCS